MAASSRGELTAAAAAIIAAAAIAGCGGSSTSSSAAATGTSTSAASTTTASTTSSATTSKSSSAKPKMPAATSSASASVATTPPPTPAGTPAAPSGLTQTTGYATYELCSVHCSGAVPGSLRRPLHISGASCSSRGASGPVTPSVSGTLPVTAFIGSKWDAGRVTWTAPAGFTGPILIRGGEIGAPAAVGFGEGRVPYDELQLYAAPGRPHQWQSFTRVRGPGCYAFQVDTAAGSNVIPFRVS
jgi:hypothetical protein